MNKKLLKAVEEITTYALSRKSGIPETTIRRWRKGQGAITLDNAEKIATAIGFELRLTKVKT